MLVNMDRAQTLCTNTMYESLVKTRLLSSYIPPKVRVELSQTSFRPRDNGTPLISSPGYIA